MENLIGTKQERTQQTLCARMRTEGGNIGRKRRDMEFPTQVALIDDTNPGRRGQAIPDALSVKEGLC